MFLLLSSETAEKAAEQTERVPIIVRLVNQYFGEWAYNFEMKYTYPKWKWLFAKFGSTPEAAFGAYTPEAYERLLLEAITGDATLFIRRDEVETAWRIVDPVREAWEGRPLGAKEFYPAGTWGPVAADELLAQRGHAWRNPQPIA